MIESLRIFKLLMYKNAIVRKRHWKLILFVEVSIPVLLFLIGQTLRMISGYGPMRINFNITHIPDYRYKSCNKYFQLRYTPKNDLADKLMEETRKCMDLLPNQLISSVSEDELLNDVAREQAKDRKARILGVILDNVEGGKLPQKFKYKIRTTSRLPNKLYQTYEDAREAAFFSLGNNIVFMQKCLDKTYIKTAAPDKSSINITISTQLMPYPPHVLVDPGVARAGEVFAELARLAFLIVMCVEITFPINEKYNGINILMSVNGVKDIQNLFSWLISGAVFSIVYLAPIVIMLKYFLPPSLMPFLKYGNSFVVWLVLTIHACHVIAFGMHIAAYFWQPSNGVFVTLVLTMVMNNVDEFVTNENTSRFLIYLGILSPNFLLERLFVEINFYENHMRGIGWDNMFTPGDRLLPPESCWGVLIIFSLLGIVIHFFLAVYVYAVRPGKYGVAQSPFFFLQKSNKLFHNVEATHFDYNREDQKEFEKVPEGTLIPGIQIRKLKKAYKTGWFGKTMVHALRGINVDFYQGQITALLGHKGAGKTTMMSILSGLTSSTEGMVFIDGKNVEYELQAVQKNLGLCPQENMVFPDLTVFEQVMFFGMLKAKNKTKAELAEEVKILLEKVNLSNKKNSLVEQLSDSQKRRMCLATAVIGDASVLILDEPTSGMDAESKQEVWNIIQELRGDKTILISTHYVQEADILGDRIAIIDSGKMLSYGTSLFLKKLYGDEQVEGIFLRATKEHDGNETDLAVQAVKSSINPTDPAHFYQTVHAFFREKLIFIRKNPRTFFTGMLLRCVAVILNIPCNSGITTTRKYALTVDAYAPTQGVVYSAESSYGEKYMTSMKDFGGTAKYIETESSVNDALLTVASNDFSLYRSKFIVSGEFNHTENHLLANGYYSGRALLSMPATVNMLTNAIVKVLTGNDEYSISISAEEFPKASDVKKLSDAQSVSLSLAIFVFLAHAVTLYAMQPSQENLSRVKEFQAMKGASRYAYWGCMYLFDLFEYTISIVLFISLIVIVDVSYGTQYYYAKENGIFFLTLLMVGKRVFSPVHIFSSWTKSLKTTVNLLSISPLILSSVDTLLLVLKEVALSQFKDVRIFPAPKN